MSQFRQFPRPKSTTSLQPFRLAIVGVVGILVGAHSTNVRGDVVFNTFETAAGYFTSVPHDLSHHAETIQIDNSLAPTSPYRLDTLETRIRLNGQRTYENLTATVRFWGDHNGASNTNVFSNLLSEVDFSFGDITVASSSQNLFPVLDYLSTGNAFIVPSNQTIGLEIDWTDDADSNDIQSYLALSAVPPDLVGSSSFGAYFDADENDQFSSSEFLYTQFNANLQLRMNATAIPEPSSIGFLALSLLWCLGRSRTRRSHNAVLD